VGLGELMHDGAKVANRFLDDSAGVVGDVVD